jgi:hypothetical protein
LLFKPTLTARCPAVAVGVGVGGKAAPCGPNMLSSKPDVPKLYLFPLLPFRMTWRIRGLAPDPMLLPAEPGAGPPPDILRVKGELPCVAARDEPLAERVYRGGVHTSAGAGVACIGVSPSKYRCSAVKGMSERSSLFKSGRKAIVICRKKPVRTIQRM